MVALHFNSSSVYLYGSITLQQKHRLFERQHYTERETDYLDGKITLEQKYSLFERQHYTETETQFTCKVT